MVFIVFEGLDASGKSTQAQMLGEYLKDKGRTVTVRIHPSDTNFGLRAKHFLLLKGWKAHFASAIFYILDILWSVLSCPWWLYDYVIFVRYLMGTAYLPTPLNHFAYHFFATVLPRPKTTFFLNVEPEEAHGRIMRRNGSVEMFESLAQLKKVCDKARYLASVKGWIYIDANRSEKEVGGQLITILNSIIE